MKGNDRRDAHCLCGAVTFTADVERGVNACHCGQCQRWTGGGPLFAVRVHNVELNGKEHIRSFRASSHGERAFCTHCGTSLYWKIQGQKIAFLPVGLFDDQSNFSVTEEIFADHRPGWLPIWPNANQHDEAEMQAQLNAFLKGNDG